MTPVSTADPAAPQVAGSAVSFPVRLVGGAIVGSPGAAAAPTVLVASPAAGAACAPPAAVVAGTDPCTLTRTSPRPGDGDVGAAGVEERLPVAVLDLLGQGRGGEAGFHALVGAADVAEVRGRLERDDARHARTQLGVARPRSAAPVSSLRTSALTTLSRAAAAMRVLTSLRFARSASVTSGRVAEQLVVHRLPERGEDHPSGPWSGRVRHGRSAPCRVPPGG